MTSGCASRRTRARRAAALLVVATAVSGMLSAHPHIFMDARVEVAWNAEGLSGFWIVWRFDRAFSAGILLDFDRDRNKRLNAEEVREIERNAFSNLVHYNYFTYIQSGGTLHKPDAVRDFSASVEGDRLIYRFFVPHALPLGSGESVVRLALYDETFFCDIGYDERNPVRFLPSETMKGSYDIREDRGVTIEYSADDVATAIVSPREIVLRLRRGR